jgi:predicted RecB family endonuclease
MDRSTWKKWERWWADALGGDKVNAKRIPVTGRQSGDVPDVETIKFAVEVKAGKVVSSRTLKAIDQAIKAGRSTGKIPIVAQTHKINDKVAVHLVTMDIATFLHLTDDLRKEEMKIKKQLDASADISI